jgi:hypothetical protein
MSDKSIVRLHAYATVMGEDWDVFIQMVAAVGKIVQKEGPETVLTHKTYQKSGSYDCQIVEIYKDEQAFLNHLENIKPVSEKFKLNWKISRIELSGAYSPETVNLLKEADRECEVIFYDTLIE